MPSTFILVALQGRAFNLKVLLNAGRLSLLAFGAFIDNMDCRSTPGKPSFHREVPFLSLRIDHLFGELIILGRGTI